MKDLPDFTTMDDEDLLDWYLDRLDWDVPGILWALTRARAEIVRRMATGNKKPA